MTLSTTPVNQIIIDRDDLISRAYKAIGYRPTRDNIIINDRYNALKKLSDAELLQLINKAA